MNPTKETESQPLINFKKLSIFSKYKSSQIIIYKQFSQTKPAQYNLHESRLGSKNKAFLLKHMY